MCNRHSHNNEHNLLPPVHVPPRPVNSELSETAPPTCDKALTMGVTGHLLLNDMQLQ